MQVNIIVLTIKIKSISFHNYFSLLFYLKVIFSHSHFSLFINSKNNNSNDNNDQPTI